MAAAKKKAAAKTTASLASDPFFTGAKERDRAGIWQHDADTIGSAILGRLSGTKFIPFADNKRGLTLIFSPAIERTASGELVVRPSISTIASTTLADRINHKTDIGKVFAIRHTGFEPSKVTGHQPFKTFDVAESTPAALAKQLNGEGASDLAAQLTTGKTATR